MSVRVVGLCAALATSSAASGAENAGRLYAAGDGASSGARRFAAYIVTKPAQDIPARHGFTPVAP